MSELLIRAIFAGIQILFMVYCIMNFIVFKHFDSLIILFIIILHVLNFVMGLILYIIMHDDFISIIQPMNNVVHQFISPALYIAYYHKILKSSPNQKFQKWIAILFLVVIPFLVLRKEYKFDGFDFITFLFTISVIFLSLVNFFIDFLSHQNNTQTKNYFPIWISLSIFTVYIILIPVLFAGRFVSDIAYLLIYYAVISVSYIIIMLGIQNSKKVLLKT